MMTVAQRRSWIVKWVYAVVLGHLVAGLVLPWIGGLALFDAYHSHVDAGFWDAPAPAAARAQQLWWIGLFGATIQGAAVWMGALAYVGDRQRCAFAWLSLIVGLLLWAPQDMLISLRAGVWAHVWLDCLALLVTLPPLFWLWRHDRNPSSTREKNA